MPISYGNFSLAFLKLSSLKIFLGMVSPAIASMTYPSPISSPSENSINISGTGASFALTIF